MASTTDVADDLAKALPWLVAGFLGWGAWKIWSGLQNASTGAGEDSDTPVVPLQTGADALNTSGIHSPGTTTDDLAAASGLGWPTTPPPTNPGIAGGS